MPPLFALILCTMFVAYRLWADRPKVHRVTISLWLPTLWLLYCSSRSLAYWFESRTVMLDYDAALEEGSQIDRLFLSSLIVLAVVVLIKRRVNWAIVFHRNRWLTVLYSYAFLSVFWSEIPFSSFKRFVRLLGGVIMALIILTDTSPRKSLEIVLTRMVYILIPFSLLLIKYYPNLGVAYKPHTGAKSWCGVTMGKNELGILCMVSGLFLVWNFFTFRRERVKPRSLIETVSYLLVCGMTLFMLVGDVAYSATALACLPAGVITFLLLRMAKRYRVSVGLKGLVIPVVAIFLLAASLPFINASPVSGVTGVLGRDATFTARTDIWEILIPLAFDDALLGHGFGGFWTGKTIAVAEVNEAHNGYLEVILILGVVGLFLLFAFLISYCSYVHRCLLSDRDANWAIFGFCLLIMLLLHGATEVSFLSETDVLWAGVIFVSTKYRSVEAPEISASEEPRSIPHEEKQLQMSTASILT